MQIKFNRKLRSALALTVCAAMLLSCSQKKDETSSADTTSTQSPITEDTGEILTLPDYDFYSLDLSKYVKLPEDHLTRDYGEGLRLLGIPSDKTVMANLKKDVLEKLAKEKRSTKMRPSSILTLSLSTTSASSTAWNSRVEALRTHLTRSASMQAALSTALMRDFSE